VHIPKLNIIISNQKLFLKKAATLFMASIALVPLIHYKLYIPATLYIGSLLILHLLFLYMYFMQVPWREIGKNKKALSLRLTSIIFLIYLLTLIKLEGETTVVITRLILVFIIHLLILLFMMVIKISLQPQRH
jgi:hypothetical protein